MSDIRPETMIREAWLNAAVEALRQRFSDAGYPLPEALKVSVGFPHIGVRGENASILAVCYAREASTIGINEIFISPMVDDAPRVLDILVHELCHAALNNADGHRGRFAKVAKTLGLEGKMTATVAGVVLAAEMVALADTLGPYPHKAMDRAMIRERETVPATPGSSGPRISTAPPRQSTRMLKVSCPCCGYTVRTTAKWLEVGNPYCPTGTEMLPA